MVSEFRPAAVVLLILSVITGMLYPLAVTVVAQRAFPDAANGSLLVRDGRVIGSRLIGQPFSAPMYFWSRPSATSPVRYNAAASGGSNLGPLNPALTDAVKARIIALRSADPGQTVAIPIDLVTSSASGLDPHISPAAAAYQMPRVARLRGLPESELRDLVARYTEPRQLLVLGEPRVNVLALNIALDAASSP